MRFLMIDRITLWHPGVRGVAVKCVALSEDFFEDHFPLKPILPGVLLIEGMAQLAGLLLEEGARRDRNEDVKALLSLIDRTKFRTPVKPGDRIEYQAEVVSVNDGGGKVDVKALVDGDLVADSSLLFSFHRIDNPYLESRRKDMLDLWLQGATVIDE